MYLRIKITYQDKVVFPVSRFISWAIKARLSHSLSSFSGNYPLYHWPLSPTCPYRDRACIVYRMQCRIIYFFGWKNIKSVVLLRILYHDLLWANQSKYVCYYLNRNQINRNRKLLACQLINLFCSLWAAINTTVTVAADLVNIFLNYCYDC